MRSQKEKVVKSKIMILKKELILLPFLLTPLCKSTIIYSSEIWLPEQP